jgi:hypothetical protein
MFSLKDVWPGHAPSTPRDPLEVKLPEKCPATGKFRHKTREQALMWRDSLYAKNPDCYLEVYRCKHMKGCGDWHVGNR